jgi:hypothetical protein
LYKNKRNFEHSDLLPAHPKLKKKKKHYEHKETSGIIEYSMLYALEHYDGFRQTIGRPLEKLNKAVKLSSDIPSK